MCFYDITLILSLLPNSITYGSDTSDGIVGNGERGQNLERGELVNFAPGLGGKHTSRKGSIRVFWGFRSSASPNCKVNSLVWSFRGKLPAANATKAGWSWPEMLKGSTSSCTATVLDTTSPKELNWTQFMIGTRTTYTDCKDEREASRRLNSSGFCRSFR